MKLFVSALLLVLSQVNGMSIPEAGINSPEEDARLNAAVDPSKAMQSPDLFEGDVAGIDPHDRNAITSPKALWTHGIIYYQIRKELANQRALIKKAMDQYTRKTKGCIKFVESTGQGNYIHIGLHNGCWSMVGMVGGEQTLSLGYGCHYIGTIVHELGHALGFHHEQNRSDRDKYLHINMENVSPSMRYNFKKLAKSHNLLMTGFDYDSIMEYGSKAFSMNGKITIQVLDHTHTIDEPYNKPGLTEKDLFSLDSLYSCAGYTRPPVEKADDILCHFEKDFCIFSSERGTEQIRLGHRPGSDNHYLMAETADKLYRFITPGFQLFSDSVCVKFKYRVDGGSVETVYFVATAPNFQYTKGISGKQTSGWVNVQYEFKPVNNFRIYFDVRPKQGASFGLDDFFLGMGKCK